MLSSRSAPATTGSHSHVVSVHPGGGSIHRRILSGVNMAAQTRRLGASNERMSAMVVSLGVEICKFFGVGIHTCYLVE
jgi:hypothetical protein